MNPSVRGDIRKLQQQVCELEKGLLAANKAYAEARDLVVAVHREQSAFRAIVQRRFDALHDAIQRSGPLSLRRRLRALLLPITKAEVRAEVERVEQELRALAKQVAPGPEAPLTNVQEESIRKQAEERWRSERRDERQSSRG